MKIDDKDCDWATEFDVSGFISAVVKQDADALRNFFTSDALVFWHDSNEQFTVPEYIRANCEYPGSWDGKIQRVEKTDAGLVIVTRIFSEEQSLHVTAFLKLENGRISRLDEYYSDCGEVPQWRQNMKIGKKIIGGKSDE